jgi:hypothetical protein
MDDTRRIVADAIASADQTEAEYQSWRAQRQRTAPAPNDELVYKTVERPAPPEQQQHQQMSEEQNRAWNDWAKAHVEVAREETNLLAKEAGSMIGKLERRVRELEMQVGYEKQLRELEAKLNKLSADMDADHARTAAPLIPLKGGRSNAA